MSQEADERTERAVLRKARWMRPLRGVAQLLPKRGPFGFLRYGLTQLERGDLEVGSEAPDASVVALDGSATSLLHDLHDRPLVLVFGSFT